MIRVLAVGSMYPPHDLAGGYELTWRSAVEHMRALGWPVRVLTTDFRAPEASGEDDADVHRELRWYWRDHGFPRIGWRARVTLERHNADVFDRHVREFRPDAVCWWAMGGMSLGLLERARRRGLPAVGVVGDEWMVWGPRMDAWSRPFRSRPRLAAAAERLTRLPTAPQLGAAASWVFNSATTLRKSAAAGWELERAEVAHPGIDHSLFRPAGSKEWEWRLLYLGRLDERKGVHLAVDALAHLPEAATLTLQGSGDRAYLSGLRRRAEAAGVADRVRFASAPRPELPSVYAAADAVVFPVQWDEPWGLVPLEAMAVGRPVVATGTGGSGEYLRDGENCLLFAPQDSPAALAGAVVRLAEDRSLRDAVLRGGAETAARFTEEGYNRAIAGALQRAAGGRT